MEAKLEGLATKDSIVFSSIAGAAGGAAGWAYSYTLYLLGITPMASLHLAAALTTRDVIHLTFGAASLATVIHLAVSATFGVLLCCLLLHTGRDYWWYKGIFFGLVSCIVLHTYLIPLMRTDLRGLIENTASAWVLATTHILIGLVTAFVLARYYEPLKTHPHRPAGSRGSRTRDKA